MSIPTVTCIIPSLGRNELFRAINSVLLQTIEVEIVVILDKTASNHEFLQNFKSSRVRIIKSEFSGASNLRNLGVALSSSRYIAFLDDDDYWLPDKIEKQLQAIKNGIAVVSTLSIVKRDKSVLLRPRKISDFESAQNFARNYYQLSWRRNKHYIPISGLLIDTWNTPKLFFNESLEIREDLQLIMQLMNYGFTQVPHFLIVVNVGLTRSWKRENLMTGLTWGKHLARESKIGAVKFILGEFTRTQILKFVLFISSLIRIL
jgi:glycosyltransferase involved in cell wall biosynthesis